MKSYNPRTPRAALGLAAIALSALCIELGVVLPASSGDDGDNVDHAVTSMAAATRASTPAADAGLRYIEPIEVVAYRSRALTSAQVPATVPRRKEQG